MGVQVITGPGVPNNPRPFSPAIRAGDFVFVSGQASVSPEGQIVPDTFEGEFRRTMSAIEAILAAAGLSLKHVVQVRSYLAEGKDIPEYNKLYREYFKEPLPARTTISGCLGNPAVIKFEMDVVAYVHA